MTRVVLASASTGRLSVLRKAGIDPLVVVSGVDEEAIMALQDDAAGPGDIATALAVAKATAVSRTLDPGTAADCVVIGCDSMLYRDGRLWGKPDSQAAAIEGWRAMAGRSGELFTGHAVIRVLDHQTTTQIAEYRSTTVYFGSPSAVDLSRYVESGEPTAVAGGFTLDGLGGWFIERIDGDPSNVIGISLPLTRHLLKRAGLSISDLWQANSLAD